MSSRNIQSTTHKAYLYGSVPDLTYLVARDDMVTDCYRGDAWPNALDDARSLVSKDAGEEALGIQPATTGGCIVRWGGDARREIPLSHHSGLTRNQS